MRQLAAMALMVATLACEKDQATTARPTVLQPPIAMRSSPIKDVDALADAIVSERRQYVVVGETHPQESIKQFVGDLVERLRSRHMRVGLYLEALDTECVKRGPRACMGTGGVLDWNPPAYLTMIERVRRNVPVFAIDSPGSMPSVDDDQYWARYRRREDYLHDMVLSQGGDLDVHVVLVGAGHVNYPYGPSVIEPAKPEWNVASRFPRARTMTVTLVERRVDAPYVVRDLATITDVLHGGLVRVFQQEGLADVVVFGDPCPFSLNDPGSSGSLLLDPDLTRRWTR